MQLTVNGEPVAQEAVEREYQRLLKALGPRLPPDELARRAPGLQRQALEHAIGRLLLLGEARRREIRVAPEEIEPAVRELTRTCGGAAGFQAHLEKLQLTLTDFRRQLLEARQTERLIAQITAACPPPTEEEINACLSGHAPEFQAAGSAPDSQPAPAALRAQVRRRLTIARQNQALTAFIADLRKNAVITDANPVGG
jgi:hypothetical protein